jgi:hypothetical protein
MNSTTQIDLPIWTVQMCCLAMPICLLLLTVAVVCKRRVPMPIYLGIAALFTLTTGWMLRVPETITETAFRIVEDLTK